MYEGMNKRKYPRQKAGYFVSYRVKDKKGVYDISRTKNLSQGGMLITTGKKFEKGIQLEMMMNFPLIRQRIKITGVVLSSREVVKDSIYETRLRYVGLNESFFKKLGQFIDENLK